MSAETDEKVENSNNETDEKLKNLSKQINTQDQREKEKEYINLLKRKVLSSQKLKDEEINFGAQRDISLNRYFTILNEIKNTKELERKKILEAHMSDVEKELVMNTLDLDIGDKRAQKAIFEVKKNRLLKEGGKEIIHLTDNECDSKDLEGMMRGILRDRGKEKFNKDDIVIHTGDMLSGFFDVEKFGQFDMLLSKNLIQQGGLEGKIAEEFLEDYNYILKRVGISEEDIRLKKITNNDEFNRVYMALMGEIQPQGLIEEERKEFFKRKNRFLKNLRVGIKNWADREYKSLKEVTEKYGLNKDNFVLISGNHDVVDQMKKHFYDVMPDVGDVRDINGVKFGYGMDSSTGAKMGRHLNDLFGSQDLTEIKEQIFYETAGFQRIKKFLNKDTKLNLDDDEILDLARKEAMKSRYLGSSSIVNDYLIDLGKEAEKEIKRRFKHIKDNVPHNCDVMLNHGFISDPRYAGISDRFYKSVIDERVKENPNLLLMHGHIHRNTSGRHGGVYQLNPGTLRQGNYGNYLFDKDNQFTTSLFQDRDKLHDSETTFRTQNVYDLSGTKDSGNNSMN